jgi:hypothetical protein
MPKNEENFSLEEIEAEIARREEEKDTSKRSGLDTALEASQFTASPVRATIDAATRGGFHPIEGLKEGYQYTKGLVQSDTLQDALDLQATVPSGRDIVERWGVPNAPIYSAGSGFIPNYDPALYDKNTGDPKSVIPTWSQAAGGALELTADAANLIGGPIIKSAGKVIKPLINLKKFAARNAANVVAKLLPSGEAAAKIGVDPLVLGSRIVEEPKLLKNINNPSELHQALHGRSGEKTVGSGKDAMITSTKEGNGLIHEAIKEIDDDLAKFGGTIDSEELIDKMINKAKTEILDPNNMNAPLQIERIAPLRTVFNEFLKPTKKGRRTLSELNAAKRSINSRISEVQIYASLDKSVNAYKEALEEISRGLTEEIVSRLPADAAKKFVQRNNRLHHFIQLSNMTNGDVIAEIANPTLIERAVKSATGALAGYSIFGGTGAATGAAGGGISSVSRLGIFGKIPGMMAKSTKYLEQGMGPYGRMSLIGARNKTAEDKGTRSPYLQDLGRSPQSLGEALIDTPIPRNTEEVLKNKDFILAKIGAMAPDVAQHAQEVIAKDPEQIDKVLSLASDMFPQLFKADKYGRWDNVVSKPNMKRASDDLRKDPNLNNTQRMNLLNRLHLTGKLEYDPQKAK